MLACDPVCFDDNLCIAVADDDLAMIAPRRAGDCRGRQLHEQALDLAQRVTGQLFGSGEQDGGAIGAMLRLPENVGRAQFPVDAVVRDD